MKIFTFSATMLNNLCCYRKTDNAHNRNLSIKESRPSYFEEGELGHLFFRYYYMSKREGLNHRQSLDKAEERTRLFYSGGLSLPVEECERVITLSIDNLEYWKNDGWTPIRVEEVFEFEVFRDNDYYLQNDEEDLRISQKIEQVRESNLEENIKLATIESIEKEKHGLILSAEGIIDLEVLDSEGKKDIVDHKFISRNRDPDDLSYQFMLYALAFGKNRMKINHVGKQKSLKPTEKYTRWIRSYSPEILDEFKSDVITRVLTWLKYDADRIYPPEFTACDRFNTDCAFKKICKTEPRMRESIISMYYRTGETYNPFKDRERTGRKDWFSV